MFTKYPFSIEIKNPCNEDFSKMTTTQQGKFCNNCQKEVLDFTKFSDAELIDWIERNNYQKSLSVLVIKPKWAKIFKIKNAALWQHFLLR